VLAHGPRQASSHLKPTLAGCCDVKRKLFLIALLVLLTSVAGACTPKRFGIRTYERCLSLEMTIPSEVRLGSVVDAHYLLRNESDQRVEACLSQGKGYNLINSVAPQGRVSAVDHPGCEQRFVLDVGEIFEWTDEVEFMQQIGVGSLSVNGWIQIVDPMRCDRYGCDSVNISSESVRVDVY
jgi:hypothetical protein